MQGIVHYSSDTVFLWSSGKEQVIPYRDLERALPKTLVARVQDYQIDEIVAINGPGGFTALRIGSLALQTLKEFSKQPVTLYEMSKISLYGLLVEQGLIPPVGLLHIGQKKKLRRVAWSVERSDSEPTISVFDKTELDSLDNCNYFVDMMEQHILLEQIGTTHMVYFSSHNNGLGVKFHAEQVLLEYKALQQLGPVEIVKPNYMIEPTLS